MALIEVLIHQLNTSLAYIVHAREVHKPSPTAELHERSSIVIVSGIGRRAEGGGRREERGGRKAEGGGSQAYSSYLTKTFFTIGHKHIQSLVSVM